MRVTRLEIFGFKSFVERFSLNFDERLIGIVGPNGSGKSNIVDALRWVLGETQAKQLRGAKQEDLIFNGSESRRPLGMAEVSITIRPSEHWSKEVEGQHDEFSKLLEEVETHTDEAPKEEEATQSDDLDSEAESSDVVVEEAKVEKPKLKVNAASGILSSGLTDLPGLFRASEIQVTRRLYRSGESEYFINKVPCRLRDMTELYRLIGLGARGLNIVQQGQIGQLISKKPVERRELLEEAAGISGFRAKLEAANRKLSRTSDNISRLKDITLEVEKQVKVLKRQATRAKARQELKDSLKEAELLLFAGKALLIEQKRSSMSSESESIKQREQQEEAVFLKLDAQSKELRAEIEVFDQSLVENRRERDEYLTQLNVERTRLQRLEKDLVRCETEVVNIADNQREIDRREVELKREIATSGDKQEELESERRVFEGQLFDSQKALEELQRQVADELSQIESDASTKLQAIGSAEEGSTEINVVRASIDSLSKEIEAVGDLRSDFKEKQLALKKSREALNGVKIEHVAVESERRALAEREKKIVAHTANVTDQDGLSDGLSSLISQIRVPENLEKAVAAALGDKGEFVVSPDSNRLGVLYSERGQASAKLGVITANESLKSEAVEISDAERGIDSSISLLLSEISFESSVAGALGVLLSDVALVKDIKSALEIQKAGGAPCRSMLVTRDGEVVTPWGWYNSSGSKIDYRLGSQIAELDVKEEQLQSRAAELQRDFEAVQSELDAAETRMEAHSEKQRELSQLRSHLSSLLEQERVNAKEQQRVIREQERAARELSLAKEREAQSGMQAVLSEVNKRVSQIEFHTSTIERLESELQGLAERRQQLNTKVLELDSKGAELKELLISPSDSQSQVQLEDTLKTVEGSLAQLEDERSQVSLKLAELANDLSGAKSALDGSRADKGRLELESQRIDMELELLEEELTRVYPEEQLSSLSFSSDDEEQASTEVSKEEVTGLSEEALKLRRRLEREGEVDPTSIERYEEESTRLEQLRQQEEDLSAAFRTLERTVVRLKQLSKARFLETFGDVSKKFEALVPRLFGGGSGSMQLVDPADPLTSGVEIQVRPPGKRLSSMELLSGGEKALVATSVLIAMFLHRPSPVCVLDEVDAPLDDANLDRFVSVIREIADQTQFLMITHNKATMASMDRLLGITMQEAGISTALSVNFEEAEQEIDRWVANA